MDNKKNSKTKMVRKYIILMLSPLLFLPILLGITLADIASYEFLEFLMNALMAFLVGYPIYCIILIIIMRKKAANMPYDQQEIDTLLNGAPEIKPNILLNLGKSLLSLMITWPLCWIVAVIIAAIIPSLPWNNADEAFAGTILSIIPTIFIFRWFQKEDQEKLKQKKIDFYKECVGQNIYQVESPVEVQKAQLIAEKMGFNKVSNIAAFYVECKKLLCQQEGQKESDAFAKVKSEEQKKFEEYTKYAEFTAGREKRITMLADELKVALDEKAKAAADLEAARNFGMQKEKGWGFRAGMASALGGTGAAVATAMDVAKENAQIRANNEANSVMRTLVSNSALDRYNAISQKVENLRKQLDDAQTKLVHEADSTEILRTILFSQIKTTVSDTGAIEIEATAKLRQAQTIFDGLAAVVDGTVIAEIYDNNARVGETKVVLPALGLSHHTESTIKSIYLTGGNKEKKYQVRFKPYHLWKMEA